MEQLWNIFSQSTLKQHQRTKWGTSHLHHIIKKNMAEGLRRQTSTMKTIFCILNKVCILREFGLFTTLLFVISSLSLRLLKQGYAKKYSKTVPLEVQVAHYTPSIFPLVPVINETVNQLCSDSWKKIVNKKELQRDDQGNTNGQTMAGITLFYNDFYSRLAEVDKNAKIEAVLSAHSSGGMNKIAEKGAIIIRIVNYCLSLKNDDAQTQDRLYILGKAHWKRKIRPYMYSVFVQCLLYTLAGNQSFPLPHFNLYPYLNLRPDPIFDCCFS